MEQVLTGVGERDGGGAGEVACTRRGAGALEDGVEGVGGVRGEGVGQVAEAGGLDGRAVRSPRGAARVVQRRLQRLVRRPAPRDAPRRARRPRHKEHEHDQRRQRHGSVEPQRRGEAPPAPPHVVGVDRRTEQERRAVEEKEREREGKGGGKGMWSEREREGGGCVGICERGRRGDGRLRAGAGRRRRISSSRSFLPQSCFLFPFLCLDGCCVVGLGLLASTRVNNSCVHLCYQTCCAFLLSEENATITLVLFTTIHFVYLLIN